jgi:hypothetical protein
VLCTILALALINIPAVWNQFFKPLWIGANWINFAALSNHFRVSPLISLCFLQVQKNPSQIKPFAYPQNFAYSRPNPTRFG